MDFRYQSPVITVKEVEDLLNIKYHAANALIHALTEYNILEESTGYSRNRIFVFRRHIDTFSEHNNM